jgi:hypothetical protein
MLHALSINIFPVFTSDIVRASLLVADTIVGPGSWVTVVTFVREEQESH